jgi:hypothetical protein
MIMAEQVLFSIQEKKPENQEKVLFWTIYRNNKPKTNLQNSIKGVFFNNKFWSDSDNWVLSEVEFWTQE